MARGWGRPSLASLALFAAILATATSDDDDDYFLAKMADDLGGKMGINFNMRKNVPYIRCEIWNRTANLGGQECPTSSGRVPACYAVFRIKESVMEERAMNETKEVRVLQPDEYEPHLGVCWADSPGELRECNNECIAVADERKADKKYGIAKCCCRTHDCNTNVTVRFGKVNDDGSASFFESLLLYVIIGAGIVVFGIIIFCILWRRFSGFCRKLGSDENKTDEKAPLVETARRVHLLDGLTRAELIARGRMGTVHKGTYTDPNTGKERTVAVKSIREEQKFMRELHAYGHCDNRHAHVVHCIGVNCDSEQSLFEVVLEYHELGSLEEYLKTETFSPLASLSFLCSLMDGLQFLHSPAIFRSGANKWPIVHRDLKSRNVLVKADRTAAIADFGEAEILTGNGLTGPQHQVGTPRYMAPELLDAKAILDRKGLQMIDIYASSLIFWEMLNRTVVDEEDHVQPAQLPYSEEIEEAVAAQETAFRVYNPLAPFHRRPIDVDLKDIVHKYNKRPVMRERLRKHPITNVLVNTAWDMWELDVDGRISAACAHARLKRLKEDEIEKEKQEAEEQEEMENEDGEEKEVVIQIEEKEDVPHKEMEP